MTTVAATAVALANGPAPLALGFAGKHESNFAPAQGQALDAANGNKIANLVDEAILLFRTTAAAIATVTVFADVNGIEQAIDVLSVPSNAAEGGVLLYKPPARALIDWRNHDTTSSANTGSLVFKSSTANCVVSCINPNRG